MELQYLNGFEEDNDDFDEIIDNDYPMDAQAFLIDDELLGLEGRAERRARKAARKAKRQGKKIERKARRAEIKKLPRKERFKARVKKGFHALNRFNPATTLLRLGILASMKLNLLKVARKIRFGYWSQAEAERNNMDLNKYRQLVQIRTKLERIFFGVGGKTANLKKAILSGKGNSDRKVVLNGLGSIIETVEDEDDLITIIGADIYHDEIEEGVSGLGAVATGAAIASATGVIGTIAALIKKLGVLFKKNTPEASQEEIQEVEDNDVEQIRKFNFKNLQRMASKKAQMIPNSREFPSLVVPTSYSVPEERNEVPFRRQELTEEFPSPEEDKPKKKGVVKWVEGNKALTAGIVVTAIGGTFLAIKALKKKKKPLSGVPKKKRKQAVKKKPKRVVKKPVKKTRSKKKVPTKRTRRVQKVKLL